jgi:hypothetical protein
MRQVRKEQAVLKGKMCLMGCKYATRMHAMHHALTLSVLMLRIQCHRAVARAPARETAALQAIDDQVDQLASAAGAALGSLWSGIGGAITSGLSAAGHVARQIEQVAQRAASPDKSPSPRWAAAKAASLFSGQHAVWSYGRPIRRSM